jgi:hypothetical protein
LSFLNGKFAFFGGVFYNWVMVEMIVWSWFCRVTWLLVTKVLLTGVLLLGFAEIDRG